MEAKKSLLVYAVVVLFSRCLLAVELGCALVSK